MIPNPAASRDLQGVPTATITTAPLKRRLSSWTIEDIVRGEALSGLSAITQQTRPRCEARRR